MDEDQAHVGQAWLGRQMLTPHLPYDPSETSISYACRTSRFHTGQPMPRILADLGVKLADFRSGQASAIERFSRALNVDHDDMQRGTFRLLSRYNRFRGEDLQRSFGGPRAVKFCPHCLAGDGGSDGWRHRTLWCFRPVIACPIHAVELCEASSTLVPWDIRETVEALGGLEAARCSATPISDSNHFHWIRGRLEGSEPKHPWLQDQSIDQVITASEMVGAVLECGPRVKVGDLPRTSRSKITETGFDICKEGPDAILSSFDEMRRRAGKLAVQAGPLAIYGSLFDWLERRANLLDPGPIRDVLREHILSNFPLDRGEMVLGKEVEERRFHSMQSLSEALNLDRRRLSRLMQKVGLVPLGASDADSGLIVFPVQETEQLCEDVATAVPLAEVPAYVCGSKRQVEILYREGLLRPLFPAASRGQVRKVVFARRHLEDFLAWLEALPVEAEEKVSGLINLAAGCQQGPVPVSTLFRWIESGKVPAWRHAGRVGLAAVRIDLSDIRRELARHPISEESGDPPGRPAEAA